MDFETHLGHSSNGMQGLWLDTTKFTLLERVPLGVTTDTVPVVAPVGTVALM